MFSIKSFKIKKRGLLTVKSNSGGFSNFFNDQFNYALRDLEIKLNNQGSSLSSIISMTIYLDSDKETEDLNLAWNNFLSTNRLKLDKKILIQPRVGRENKQIEIIATALIH
ncbi:Rid family hydrolase [Marinospirillum minutulum]|uniref:Rid family hydrolase n=1 Tax=Marinospirillum minutulum TaxID=64974 RepID=UPI000488A680|nr:Rid family hydrolase [Marinospirillum minutulum]